VRDIMPAVRSTFAYFRISPAVKHRSAIRDCGR
jgi:hypothetical protein